MENQEVLSQEKGGRKYKTEGRLSRVMKLFKVILTLERGGKAALHQADGARKPLAN